MPTPSTVTRRDLTVRVRLSPTEHKRIVAAARKADVPMSTFLRKAALATLATEVRNG